MREVAVGYSKDRREIQITVPHGTKLADLAKVIDFMARDVFAKLPRGCTNCTSGDHFIIKEELENIVRVDLDQRVVIR
jgi:hypothetical protein